MPTISPIMNWITGITSEKGEAARIALTASVSHVTPFKDSF